MIYAENIVRSTCAALIATRSCTPLDRIITRSKLGESILEFNGVILESVNDADCLMLDKIFN